MRDAALAFGSAALILAAFAGFAWLVNRHRDRPPRGLSEADQAWQDYLEDERARVWREEDERARVWREEDERVMSRLAEPETALWGPVETAARRDRGRLDEGGWGVLAEAAESRPMAAGETPALAPGTSRDDGEGERRAFHGLNHAHTRGEAGRPGNDGREGPEGERGPPVPLAPVASPRAQRNGLCVCDAYGMCPQGCEHCAVCGGPGWQDDPGHDAATPGPPEPPRPFLPGGTLHLLQDADGNLRQATEDDYQRWPWLRPGHGYHDATGSFAAICEEDRHG